MARDCLSGLATFALLLLTLQAGRPWSAAALRCYQSRCLDAGPASCERDSRVELRDCSSAHRALGRLLGRAPPPAAAAAAAAAAARPGRMTCVTHGARGKEGGSWRELVLKMCFVDLPNLCALLENVTNSAFRAEGSTGHAKCASCHTDACNSACLGRPGAAAALLAAGCALLARQ